MLSNLVKHKLGWTVRAVSLVSFVALLLVSSACDSANVSSLSKRGKSAAQGGTTIAFANAASSRTESGTSDRTSAQVPSESPLQSMSEAVAPPVRTVAMELRTAATNTAPATPVSRQAYEPTQHPRLFFTSDDILTLRAQAETTHQDIWQPILTFAQRQLNSTPPAPPACNDLNAYRYAGDQLVAFSFAYVITGDPAYLDLTRRYLLAYAGWPRWAGDVDCDRRDLGFHHLLQGSAIAYDWVYEGLSTDDRGTIGGNLGQRAQESYDTATCRCTWWRQSYSQNHNWINFSALGMAALVLDGEDERAPTWLNATVADLTRVRSLLEGSGDASWHEGIPYQNYGLSMSLPFAYNLRRLTGTDILPHTYLRNYADWRIYNSLPGSERFILSYGDFDWSWGNGYPAQNLLRFGAREYRDGRAEWAAQQLAANAGRPATVNQVPWFVFEFLYYDPSVGAQGPGDLPHDRSFPDLEGVIWRTGWGDNDLAFGLKTGAYGGRYAFDQFTTGQYPYDDPGADEYNDAHDHDDSNSFYLYRGKIDLSSEVVGVGSQLGGTSYHNTLLVDGQGQYRDPDAANGQNYHDRDPSVFQGADARLTDVYETSEFSYLVADATNRYRTSDPGDGKPGALKVDEYTRHVLFVKPGYLVMVDNLRSAAPHAYQWVAHFGTSVSVEDNWVKGTADVGQVLGVNVVAPSGFSTATGNDGKPFVRISPASNVASTRFVTVLYPTDEDNWGNMPAVESLGNDDRAAGVRVRLNGTQDHLITYGSQGTVSIGEYSFDGQVASIIKDEQGSLQRLFLGQGTVLSDNGGARVLVENASKSAAVEATYYGAALVLEGENLAGLSIYAPSVDVDQVTVNGQPIAPSKNGDYVVLPR